MFHSGWRSWSLCPMMGTLTSAALLTQHSHTSRQEATPSPACSGCSCIPWSHLCHVSSGTMTTPGRRGHYHLLGVVWIIPFTHLRESLLTNSISCIKLGLLCCMYVATYLHLNIPFIRLLFSLSLTLLIYSATTFEVKKGN